MKLQIKILFIYLLVQVILMMKKNILMMMFAILNWFEWSYLFHNNRKKKVANLGPKSIFSPLLLFATNKPFESEV